MRWYKIMSTNIPQKVVGYSVGFWRNVHQRQNTNCIFTEENFQDEISTNNCTRRAPFYFPIRMDHNHLFWSSCVKALKEHASSCTLLRFPLERKIKSWSSLIFCFPVEMATGVLNQIVRNVQSRCPEGCCQSATQTTGCMFICSAFVLCSSLSTVVLKMQIVQCSSLRIRYSS